jgi:hypothetical protein
MTRSSFAAKHLDLRFAVLIALMTFPLFSKAGDFGVNLYGASYHFERGRAKELGLDNEFNPGLGVRYRDRLNERFDWFVDAGFYRDSGRNTAIVAGPGALWRAGEGLRLGGALAYFRSDSYNAGRAFIAPIPVAAYDWRAVTLNVTYFPKVSHFNDINTLGFWVTVWPKNW